MAVKRRPSKAVLQSIYGNPRAPASYIPIQESPAHLRNLEENIKLRREIIKYRKHIEPQRQTDAYVSELYDLCTESIEKLELCGRTILEEEATGYTGEAYKCGLDGVCHVCNFSIAQRRVKKMTRTFCDWAHSDYDAGTQLLHATLHLPFFTCDFDCATRVMRIAKKEFTKMMKAENNRRGDKRLEYQYALCGYHYDWDAKMSSITPHLHFVFAVENCPWIGQGARNKLKNLTSRWAYHCRRLFDQCIPVFTAEKLPAHLPQRLSTTFLNMVAKRSKVEVQYIDPFTDGHDTFYDGMFDTKVVHCKHPGSKALTLKVTKNTLAYVSRQPTFGKMLPKLPTAAQKRDAAGFIMRRKLYIRKKAVKTDFVIYGSAPKDDKLTMREVSRKVSRGKQRPGQLRYDFNAKSGKFVLNTTPIS